MYNNKIYFRADGNSSMGLGHVIRSLALAEMLSSEFECHFIIRNPLPILKEQILSVCKSIIEFPETDNDIKEASDILKSLLTGEEIVVLDGYHFITEYQQVIKEKGTKLICIDDIYSYHFLADIVINHAGGVSQNNYSGESYTQYLFGLKYALLRKPFREAARNRSNENNENNIFICLGGADPNNDLQSVLQKCESTEKFQKYYVVIGGAYKYRDELNRFIRKSKLDIVLLSNLSADKMVSVMKECNSAITSPSTISYEYLSVGGVLYLVKIADNQQNINKFFCESGMAFSFDDFQNISEEKVKKSIQIQTDLLDGNMEKRYLKLLKSIIK